MPSVAPTSLFWLRPNVFRPYAPPICHVALHVDPPVPPEAQPLVVQVALNEENVQAVAPGRALGVWLVNARDGLSMRSTSFGPAALADDVKNQPRIEPFFLPITVTDGVPTATLWRGNTSLMIGIDQLERARSVQLHAKGRTQTLTATLPVETITALERRADDTTGIHAHVLPLNSDRIVADGEIDNLLKALTWEESPYRLSLIVEDVMHKSTLAWTYLHVPGPAEVKSLQALAPYRVSMLKDNFGSLAAHSAAPGDDAARQRLMLPTADEQADYVRKANAAMPVRRLVRDGQLDGLIAATQTEIRDARQGLQQLGPRPTPPDRSRNKFRTPEEMAAYLSAHDPTTYERETARFNDKLTRSTETLQRLEKEKANANTILMSDEDRALLSRIWLAAYDLNQVNALFPRGNNRYLMATSWAIIAIIKKDGHGVFRPWRLYVSGGGRQFLRSARIRYTEVKPARGWFGTETREEKRLDFHVPRPPDDALAFVEGNGSWFGYDLRDDALSLTSLITYGVSSCCAGVSFPNVDDPDTIILTHVNNYIDQPIQAAIRIVREAFPDHGDYGSFCSMLSAFPQAEELQKYAKANVFPAEVRGPSRLLMLPRSTHLYDMEAVGFIPHSMAGFSFPDDMRRAHFTGNYGYETAGQFHVARGLLGGAPMACSCGADGHKGMALLADFRRDVFGPLEPLKADYATEADICSFRDAVSNRLVDATASDKVTKAAKARLVKFTYQNLGKAMFDRLYDEAVDMPEIDGLLVGQKAKQVFGAR